MRHGKHIITIFGSSLPASGTREYETAYDLGLQLARAGFVVCNGGYGGVMEASARGTSDAGGFSLGVTTGFYAGQSPNKWLSEVLETATPIDRLLRLVHEGDGYVILPGGTGTLLEFAAVWEMINKEILSSRPVVFLGDFWHSVISLVSAELVKEGRKNATRHFLEADSPIACVEFLTNYFKVQQ